MGLYIKDIECWDNFFLNVIYNPYTQKKHIFEISERKNDIDEMIEFYNKVTKNDYMVTFNGIHYDNPIIHKALEIGKNGDYFDYLNITMELKTMSDVIIRRDDAFRSTEYKKYKYASWWKDVDIFMYWSKMLRLSKQISLKSLGIQLGYPITMELPIAHDAIVELADIPKIIEYCAVHDIGITTKAFFQSIYWQGKKTTMRDQLNLRINIKNVYGLDCYSWDAPKIASELLLKKYVAATNADYYEVKKRENSWKSKLDLQNPEYKTQEFQELYKEMSFATRTFSKSIAFNCNNTSIILDFGKGGLHSRNSNEYYISNKTDVVVTSDFASLYPNLIINYNLLPDKALNNIYTNVLKERIEAKKSGDDNKNVTYKLILNSTSGLIDNQYSWLYYPEGAMKMRLMGQLILAKCIEVLALAGYKVISANTDGIEYICPVNRKEEAFELLSSVEKQFNLELEHDIYKAIYYKNVNNYIAISKKAKKKGLFVTTPNFGDSVDALVIPKALEAYYLNGTPIKEFILSHDNIFDFCISKKVSKSYQVFYGDTLLSQRLNRYYVCKSGKYIYKARVNPINGVWNKNHIMKGWGVCLYNEHIEQHIAAYDIDYTYYISECNKIIQSIDSHRKQLSLF